MSASSLHSIFPKPEDLVALPPEDLGGAIIEIAPSITQNGMFHFNSLVLPLYPLVGTQYPNGSRGDVEMALMEAISWLTTQGLIIMDVRQPAPWYRLTRRAANLRNRLDVGVFRKGRILPDDLVPSLFAQKVVPIFRRGDFDVAVFQAFKEVEVAVRKTANSRGAGYPDSELGVQLMRKAFDPKQGPLTDTTVVISEREAVQHLFAGAIGHVKNPLSYRDFVIDAQEAAQLIIFASYLLSIVEQRA